MHGIGVLTSRVADIVLGTLRREVSEDHSWVRPDQANDQCPRLRLVGVDWEPWLNWSLVSAQSTPASKADQQPKPVRVAELE